MMDVKPRGRPRVAPAQNLTTYVRTVDYDRLVRLAAVQRKSLASLVRELLRFKLQ